MKYAMPSAERRLRGTTCLYGAMVVDALRHGEVYTTSDLAGVACWLPPGTPPMTFRRQISAGMGWVPWHFGVRGIRRLALYDALGLSLHHQIAPEPHWFLMAIGVDRGCQGRGVGSDLLEPQLARVDRERKVCFLDTHLERNVRLYEKHGFSVAWHGFPPGHPVPVWAMRRDPR
jgi:GNAT superfamily N-acetyltransferase